MTKRLGAMVVAMAVIGAAGPVSAQVGLAARASTLGVGGELSYRASKYIGLRVGANFFSTTRNTTIEGINYDIKPKLENASAILDLHPLGSAFHLSGGVIRNSNKGSVVALLADSITLGPRTYSKDVIGTLTGLIDYKTKYVPYAGLGFSGRGRLSFLFDLGVVFSGYPQASLLGTTTLTGQEKQIFEQNVQTEVDQVQADIQKHSVLKYYPVVSLGLRFGF
ncbi:MAG: hypothetical protein ABI647_22805 [Gemmatimonadota bacterium]